MAKAMVSPRVALSNEAPEGDSSTRNDKEASRALLTPSADLWLVGGLSFVAAVVLYLAFTLMARRVPSWWDPFVYFLALVVNYPHFTLSYQMLYGDNRNKVVRKKAFIFVGIIVPLGLLSALTLSMVRQDTLILQWLVVLMFTLSSWHYVKQTYGAMIVIGVRGKYALQSRERNALRAHLYLIFLANWLTGQTKGSLARSQIPPSNYYFGIWKMRLALPPALLTATYALTLISFLVLAALLIRKHREEKASLPLNVVVAYLSAPLWLLPLFWYWTFYSLIPFFHALQYYLFVITFKKNQTAARLRHQPDHSRGQRRFWLSMGAYFGLSIVLGVLAFELLPRGLDHAFGKGAWNSKNLTFVLPFWLFLNIHHYFIDGVLWRGNNPEVREFLVSPAH